MAVPEKYRHIDFKPPKAVAEAAERGLEYRKKANPSDKGGLTPAEAGEQGIGSGVQRATNLKNRNEVSPDVIRQMCAFFARHEKNKGIKPENKSTPWKQKGHVAWLLWGGDPGKTWAEKVRDQMDRADEKANKTAAYRKMAWEAGVDEDGWCHDDDGNSWFVGKEYAGQTYTLHDDIPGLSEYDEPEYAGYSVNENLAKMAEVARYLKKDKEAKFLAEMSRTQRRTPKQQQWLDALIKKYTPKIPLLDKLRAEAKRDIEKAVQESERVLDRNEIDERKKLLVKVEKLLDTANNFYDDETSQLAAHWVDHLKRNIDPDERVQEKLNTLFKKYKIAARQVYSYDRRGAGLPSAYLRSYRKMEEHLKNDQDGLSLLTEFGEMADDESKHGSARLVRCLTRVEDYLKDKKDKEGLKLLNTLSYDFDDMVEATSRRQEEDDEWGDEDDDN